MKICYVILSLMEGISKDYSGEKEMMPVRTAVICCYVTKKFWITL